MCDEKITVSKLDVVRLVVVAMTLAARDGELTANKQYIEKKVEQMLRAPDMAWTLLDPVRKSKLLNWLLVNDFSEQRMFDLAEMSSVVGNPAHQALIKAIQENENAGS